MTEARSLVPVRPQDNLPMVVEADVSGWDEHTSEGPDVRTMWNTLFQYRLTILALFVAGLLGGLLVAEMTPPTYKAQAQIEIGQKGERILGTEDEEAASSPVEAERFLQTQLDILRSRSLAQTVSQDLGLSAKDKFFKGISGKAPKPGTPPQERLREVLDLLRGNLDVSLPPNSRLATISFAARDAALSAEVTNSYVKNYIQSTLRRRFETSAYSREFVQTRLVEAKARLEKSERAMMSYARSAGIIDASAGASTIGGQSGPRSLTTANLIQLNQAYSTARAERIAAEQRWNQARQTPVMSLPEVLGNPTIQGLSGRSAELQGTLEQERQKRREEHPAVVQAAAQINEINRQVQTIAQSIRNSIRERYEVARAHEAALAGNVGQLEGETLAEQDRSIPYNILKRETETNRELYDGLLQRHKQLSAAAGIAPNNISVIDPAVVPVEPDYPRPMLNAAIGGGVGLALALFFIIGRELADDRVRTPEEVLSRLRLRLLGVLPRVPDPVEALNDPSSALSEAHHSLRAALELPSRRRSRNVQQTLLFTSSRAGEGKTTAAYGVARDLAAAGKHVLLIDADMRRPALHHYLGVDASPGLSHVLTGAASGHDVARNTSVPGLTFIPSGPVPASAAALLGGGEFASLIKEMGRNYDVVIVDGPPVFGLADAPRLAAAVSSTVFVIEALSTRVTDVRAALNRLSDARANIVGAVVTKFDARKSGYAGIYLYVSDYAQGGDPPRLQAA